jgi:pimeloyl-ACP methyl ester carboxylesterase
LAEYADLVIAAAQPFSSVILVAQSLGGFTAPMAAERLAVQELVLVNAMVPIAGETPGEWWDATGSGQAREAAAIEGGYGDFDVETYFFHDVDRSAIKDSYDEVDAVFSTTCDFTSWPTRTRVLAGADDRFFPAGFQARVAKERIGVDADTRPGGHLMALADPEVVAEYLMQGVS